MKHATRQKKQLAIVKEWLEKARPLLENRMLSNGSWAEMDLLIAMEQLVRYLEGEKELEIVRKK